MTAALTIKTTAPTTSALHTLTGPWGGLTSLAFAFPLIGLAIRSRRRIFAIVLLAGVSSLVGLSGCGGGGGNGGGGNPQPGTPAGTYTVTVTSTSGINSHAINLTLVVQ